MSNSNKRHNVIHYLLECEKFDKFEPSIHNDEKNVLERICVLRQNSKATIRRVLSELKKKVLARKEKLLKETKKCIRELDELEERLLGSFSEAQETRSLTKVDERADSDSDDEYEILDMNQLLNETLSFETLALNDDINESIDKKVLDSKDMNSLLDMFETQFDSWRSEMRVIDKNIDSMNSTPASSESLSRFEKLNAETKDLKKLLFSDNFNEIILKQAKICSSGSNYIL